ncbi:MAG: hypothetical protein OCU12_07090 [Methanophagales archaeon]|nr:hypothetical protein [Methanophagales archaeon]
MADDVKFLDPKDEYVRSREPISTRALALKWHQAAYDGYSESTLRKRCAREKWGDQRIRYWEQLRHKTIEREQQKTAEEHAAIVDRYTRLLEGVMAGAVRFLRQYDPDKAPPYKGPKEAADVLMTAIAADRKVRGMDVQKVMDVTDDEDCTDIYADLSDTELEELASSEEDA